MLCTACTAVVMSEILCQHYIYIYIYVCGCVCVCVYVYRHRLMSNNYTLCMYIIDQYNISNRLNTYIFIFMYTIIRNGTLFFLEKLITVWVESMILPLSRYKKYTLSYITILEYND